MILFRGTSAKILAVAAFVFVLDQASKLLVSANLEPGERVDLFSSVALERTSNSGIAFGLAGDFPPLILIAVAVGIVAVLLMLGRQLRWRSAWLAIGLILGGALGNLMDRALRGSVVDFISFPHWPTFNVADIAITVGVILLLLGGLRASGRR